MTGTILLTLEQDKAVKEWVDNKLTLENFIMARQNFTKEYKSIKGLSVDRMARILYEPGSFEVEQPKIKVGTLVVGLVTGSVYRVKETLDDYSFKAETLVDKTTLKSKEVRLNKFDVNLATPEEAFWAELGREVDEFKEGDVYQYENGAVYPARSPNAIRTLDRVYKEGRLRGFYPAESFVKFPQKLEEEKS